MKNPYALWFRAICCFWRNLLREKTADKEQLLSLARPASSGYAVASCYPRQVTFVTARVTLFPLIPFLIFVCVLTGWEEIEVGLLQGFSEKACSALLPQPWQLGVWTSPPHCTDEYAFVISTLYELLLSFLSVVTDTREHWVPLQFLLAK